ncbi:MAG: hypothetical protein HY237_14495 [Acidobacteria bacterium]|nr:hypothetical protein [Acidobacteriota bacterium]
MEKKCVVGIQVATGLVKAFDVCIKDGNIYVNYSDISTPEAHGSYHASGQYHIKIGGSYAKWTGGPTGDFEPMKLFHTPPALVTSRSGCWTIGWPVCRLANVLPKLDSAPDMVVDARSLAGNSVLGLEVSAVGDEATSRTEIVGYSVIATRRFGTDVRAEIEAFILPEESQ